MQKDGTLSVPDVPVVPYITGDGVGAEVTPYTIMIENKPLTMKKITLDNFMLLYRALENKRAF